MTWKLPKELEPYREYIDYSEDIYDSIEDVRASRYGYSVEKLDHQLDLLQRLYDARRLINQPAGCSDGGRPTKEQIRKWEAS